MSALVTSFMYSDYSNAVIIPVGRKDFISPCSNVVKVKLSSATSESRTLVLPLKTVDAYPISQEGSGVSGISYSLELILSLSPLW